MENTPRHTSSSLGASRALATPPPSPRKRRRELRKSEETSGTMSIEQYILRTDPFRSTTSLNPLPYPVMLSRGPEEIINRVEDLRQRIGSGLLDHGISRYMISVKDISRPGYPGGDEPVSTLRVDIIIDDDIEVPVPFGPIKDMIYEILCSHGLTELPVEVVNPFKCFQPSLFPIAPTDPTVRIYRAVRDELAEILARTLRHAWRSICLFVVGHTEEKANPTIVVMVDPRTQYDWSRLEGLFMTVLARSLPKDLTMDVEFIPGGCGPITAARGTSRMPGVSFRGRMTTNCVPEMGCSIGIEGEVGGGSLGGFVTLEVGDRVHKGFLTTHHVVQPPSNAKQQPAATIGHTARYGYSSFSASQPKPAVHYLAVQDVTATKEHLKSAIESSCRDINRLREDDRNRETAQIGRPVVVGRDQVINRLQTIINSDREMLGKVEDTMPKELGKALVSSMGRTVDGRHILDWAFVELKGPRKDQVFNNGNILPQVPEKEQPRFYTREGPYSFAGLSAVSFGVITPGEWYFKRGRTTDITAGVCNGVEAYCNWSNADRCVYDVNGDEVKTIQQGYTEEFVILSKRWGISGHVQETFCAPGDAGSFIMNRLGDVCGLLYGELTGWCGPDITNPLGTGTIYVGAGLVSCMSYVLRSVEEETAQLDGLGRRVHGPAIVELAQ